MTTHNLYLTPIKDVPFLWHEVKPLIEKALTHSGGEVTSEDILNDILTGENHLWVGIENKNTIFCAGVTEIITRPQKRILYIITFATASGSDYDLWKDFIHILDDFGSQYECTVIETQVRKGLARKLKWDNEYSVITRTIKQNGKEKIIK